MATIISRTSNFLNAASLTLRDESWTRKLPQVNNWSKMRMGFLATFGDANTPAASVLDVALTFGIGTSSGSPPGHYDCPYMIGVCPAGNPTPGSLNALTYSANAYASWSSSAASQIFTRTFDPQIGPVWTVVASASTVPGYVQDVSTVSFANTPKRNGLFVLEISRPPGGNGTATLTFYYQVLADTRAGYSFTEADLMDAVNSLGTPIIQGLTFTTTTGLSLGLSDISGPLDSLFISNNKADLPVNISAIACCVHSESNFSGAQTGSANDSFSHYGTQNFPAYSTSGSMSLGEWYGTTASSWSIFGTGWCGASMSAQNLAGTTLCIPYDPLTQYFVNDSIVTTLSGGTSWANPATFYGTAVNLMPQIGLAGTSALCPMDLLVQYIVTGGTFTGNTILNAGTGWTSAGIVSGTAANSAVQVGLAGTSVLCPMDLLVQYIVTGGTFTGGTVLSAGTGWTGAGIVNGTAATENPQLGLSGTSVQCPMDLMVQYIPGAVTSGVTINAGTGWSGAGVIH